VFPISRVFFLNFVSPHPLAAFLFLSRVFLLNFVSPRAILLTINTKSKHQCAAWRHACARARRIARWVGSEATQRTSPRDRDGLLPSKRNTVCVLDQMRESKTPSAHAEMEKTEKVHKGGHHQKISCKPQNIQVYTKQEPAWT